MKKFETETNASVASVGNTLGRLRTTILGTAAAFAAFQAGKGIVDAGVQLQALTAKMNAATGSADVAAASLRYVREEANRLGLDFRSTADGFASFAASGLRSGLTFEALFLQQYPDFSSLTFAASRASSLTFMIAVSASWFIQWSSQTRFRLRAAGSRAN